MKVRRKIKRTVTVILSLLFVTFLVLCSYSPLMQQRASGTVEKVAEQTPKPTETAVETVTLAAGSFPADTEELTAILEEGETALLGQFSSLRKLDASGSACYEELAAWAEAHPKVEVTYTVAFPGGVTADNAAETLDLSSLPAGSGEEALALLSYLPKLQSLALGAVAEDAAFTGTEVAALRERYPELALSYTFSLLGQQVDPQAESLDLTGLTHENAAGAAALLRDMPNLNWITLGSEDSGLLTWADVIAIGEACPTAVLDYAFTLWGVPTNLSTESVDLNHITMDDDGGAVRGVLPLMRRCTYVDMDFCGVPNEAMDNLRKENPDKEIVWRIWFGKSYSVRTDVIKILASKPSVGGWLTNDDVAVLKYCTKLKYLDLGHNDGVTDISFVNYMPDLEVLILTLTGVTDISPLANCPHLEYLEVTHTTVSDLSPLSNSMELRHLNIGDTQVSDISPLYGLTELERLWICLRHHVPQEQIDHMHECAPDCVINVDADDPSLGAWRFADLIDRGWENYVKTGYFLFENDPRYELLRQQFGYATEDYAFTWKDPLYDPH